MLKKGTIMGMLVKKYIDSPQFKNGLYLLSSFET